MQSNKIVRRHTAPRAYIRCIFAQKVPSQLSRDAGKAVGQGGSKWVEGNGNLQKTKYINCACFCAATMLTSEVITEIIENHSEVSGWANSCNKFVSNRSCQTMKYPMILLWKGTYTPIAPLLKGQEGNAPVIPPLSGVPATIQRSLQTWQTSSCLTCFIIKSQ